MKKEKVCKKKQCKSLKHSLAEMTSIADHRQFRINTLQELLSQKKEDQSRSSASLAARTELIKALGCAMKTCSSIAWSDRKNPYFDRT
jgi:butyrate kinase